MEFDFLCHSMSASADVYDEGPGSSTPPLPQEAYTVAKGQAKRKLAANCHTLPKMDQVRDTDLETEGTAGSQWESFRILFPKDLFFKLKPRFTQAELSTETAFMQVYPDIFSSPFNDYKMSLAVPMTAAIGSSPRWPCRFYSEAIAWQWFKSFSLSLDPKNNFQVYKSLI